MQYLDLAQRLPHPEEVGEYKVAAASIDWLSLLQGYVIPRYDLWQALEDIVYGHCMAAEDIPAVNEYLKRCRTRLREI